MLKLSFAASTPPFSLALYSHLEETIDATDERIRRLHASRGATVRMLRSLQDRIAELLAELDR